MKLYGKAHEVSQTILKAFQEPDRLPKALAPIFIKRNDDTPCRKWSFSNQLLVALAGTDDARGYKQWQEADRHVKKGAKSFRILAPCIKKVKQTNEQGQEVEAPIVYGFRAVPVFTIEDTEGADIPSGDPELDQWVANLPLREVAESWGISVTTYSGEKDKAYGQYRQTLDGEGKAIALGVQDVVVFLHELVHAAEYKLDNAVERGQHWRKETVAQLGASVLAECLGIESSSLNLRWSYDYIEGYAKASEKTVESAAIECLDRICQAVSLILDEAEQMQTVCVAA